MSYNNNFESSSYKRAYSSQNSSPWPMGIEPFSRPQQNLSPVQDFSYSSGYNNNRPLLPSPGDGPRGGMHFDYGHGAQRPSDMTPSDGPSRDDVYMTDTGRPTENYRDNWDRFDDNDHVRSSVTWNSYSNGQGPQYSSQQNFQSSFNSSYNDRSPRHEDNRIRRSYQEPIRQRNFRAGGSDSGIKRTIRPMPNRFVSTNAKWKNTKVGSYQNVPPAIKKGPYFCKVCNLTFVPYSALIAHNKTSDHNRQKQLHQNMLNKLAATKKAAQDPEGGKQAAAAKEKKPVAKAKKETLSYCTVCKTKFSGSSIDHLASDKHKLNKAMDRPFCIQCQRFFRTPTLFVKHCNSEAHKSGKAATKKDGDNVIDAEFFTLDAVGIYDSEKGEGASAGVTKPKKKKKMASLKKITISLPAGSVSQDPSKDNAALGSGGDIPVVSITQENGIETKSVSMKPAGEAKTVSGTEGDEEELTIKDESSDEDNSDAKPVGLAFVVPISGFYCQICEQFFKDENTARNDHCLSKAHRKKYKDATVEESSASNEETGTQV